MAGVQNDLDIYRHSSDVSSLQEGRLRIGEWDEKWQSHSSPTARLLIGTVSGVLRAAAARRRGVIGLASGYLGAGFLARTVTIVPFRD